MIRRALAKRPAERPPSADAMAEELRAVSGVDGDDTPVAGARADAAGRAAVPRAAARSGNRLPRLQPARTRSRRRCRASARSSCGRAPSRRASPARRRISRRWRPKPTSIAWSWARCCAPAISCASTAQLVEAPGGTLLTSHTVQSSLGDLFRPAGRHRAPRRRGAVAAAGGGIAVADARCAARRARLRAVPARQRAGAHLRRARRARAISTSGASSSTPRFAPAWARLGRCHRVIGKYIDGAPDSEARAEEAFRRALAINPRLSIAHKFYANLEADIGQAERARSCGCSARRRVTATTPSCSPGSSTRAATAACSSSRSPRTPRRAGSIPNVPTERRADAADDGRHRSAARRRAAARSIAGADDGIRVIALGLAGRRDEARERLLGDAPSVAHSRVSSRGSTT